MQISMEMIRLYEGDLGMRQLYIKQKVFKITDHYPVMDSYNNTVYLVDEEFKFWGKTIHVTKPDGSHVFTIDREMFRLMYHFVATFNDGKRILLKNKFRLFHLGIDVISDDYQLTLEGDFFALNFEVFSHTNKVGHIYSKWFSWGDTFVIDVMDPTFEEELLALMIMVDFMKDKNER